MCGALLPPVASMLQTAAADSHVVLTGRGTALHTFPVWQGLWAQSVRRQD